MRVGTWLVVVAVLAITVAAAADALRRETTRPSPSAATQTTASFRAPPGKGLAGILYYIDSDCRLRGLRFPTLLPAEAPEWDECSFSLSPDGTRVGSTTTWHPGGTAAASESDGSIDVGLVEGSRTSGYSFSGSAPAYGEHGFLTFAAGTEIRGMDTGCPLSREEGPFIGARTIRDCSRVFVSGEAVRRAGLRHPNASDAARVEVRETAWLDGSRLAVLLRALDSNGERSYLVALFEGGELLETLVGFEPLTTLRASTGGGYLAVLTSGGRVLHFDRAGRPEHMPTLTAASGYDWSPDERWLAIATAQSIYVVRTGSSPPRVRRLAIVAADIAWR